MTELEAKKGPSWKTKAAVALAGAIPTAMAALGTVWLESRSADRDTQAKDLIAYQQAQLEEAYEKLDDRMRQIDRLVAANTAVLKVMQDNDRSELASALREMEDVALEAEIEVESEVVHADEEGGLPEVAAAPIPHVEPATKTRRKSRSGRGLPKPSRERYRKARLEQKQVLDF